MKKLSKHLAAMGKAIDADLAKAGGKKVAYQSSYGYQGKAGFEVFLTPKMLARQWHTSTKTLERMRKDGSGPPYIKIGKGTIRYPAKGLDNWTTLQQAKAVGIDADMKENAPFLPLLLKE